MEKVGLCEIQAVFIRDPIFNDQVGKRIELESLMAVDQICQGNICRSKTRIQHRCYAVLVIIEQRTAWEFSNGDFTSHDDENNRDMIYTCGLCFCVSPQSPPPVRQKRPGSPPVPMTMPVALHPLSTSAIGIMIRTHIITTHFNEFRRRIISIIKSVKQHESIDKFA